MKHASWIALVVLVITAGALITWIVTTDDTTPAEELTVTDNQTFDQTTSESDLGEAKPIFTNTDALDVPSTNEETSDLTSLESDLAIPDITIDISL